MKSDEKKSDKKRILNRESVRRLAQDDLGRVGAAGNLAGTGTSCIYSYEPLCYA